VYLSWLRQPKVTALSNIGRQLFGKANFRFGSAYALYPGCANVGLMAAFCRQNTEIHAHLRFPHLLPLADQLQ
jgi:hypothetical protein